MRVIGHLADERLARRFVDYLHVKRVASQVEPEGDGRWAVWVLDDDQLATAATELEAYRSGPEAAPYKTATATAEAQKLKDEQRAQVQGKRQLNRSRLFELSWLERMGHTTFVLIVLSIAATLYTEFGTDQAAFNDLAITHVTFVTDTEIRWSRDFLPEVRAGQLWRLFTPTFIQLDPMHILFNVLLLANLGGVVERRYGWHRLMIFVLAVSAISNVCEYRFVSPLFGGLSGVVFGLFGFVWTDSKYNPNSDFVVPPMVTAMMLGWFVFCIVGLGGTVANFVHWGGLASGALIGRLAARLARSS